MLGKVLTLSILLAGVHSPDALASRSAEAGRGTDRETAAKAEGLLLAQFGDVEIFYDGNGSFSTPTPARSSPSSRRGASAR